MKNTMDSLPETSETRRIAGIRLIYFLVFVSVVGLTFSIAVSSIAMGGAIVLSLFLILTSGDIHLPQTRLDFFILAYIIAEILSTAFSVDRISSLVNMKRLFLISFVYMTLLVVDTDNKLKLILIGLVCATVFVSLFEIIRQYASHISGTRVSFFQHYMTEGGIKMIVLLLIVPFIFGASPKGWKAFSVFGSIILLTGLVLTQTRSSWLGFIGGFLTIGILRNKKIIFVLLLIIALFFLFAPSEFRSRASSIFDPTLGSNQTRLNMISTGWRMFLDRPFLGYGDIDLKQIYITYTTPIDPAEGGHLHNNYMMLLVTLGIVGFIATTSLFIKIFLVELSVFRMAKGYWLFENISLGCIGAYTGFLINGLFEWNFGDHEIAVLLWTSVGLTFVAERLVNRMKTSGAV